MATEALPERHISTFGSGRRANRIIAYGVHETRTRNFLSEFERRGFTVVEFCPKEPFQKLRGLRRFIKETRQSDFLMSGTPYFVWLFLTILVARLFGCPCAVDCPMDLTLWPFPETWRSRLGVRLALRSANLLLTIRSRRYMATKLGLRPGRVFYAESCPDTKRIEAWQRHETRYHKSARDFLLCCSGGHAPHRLERFLPVFKCLASEMPNGHLLVISDPANQISIDARELAKMDELADRIHLLPIIKPPEDFYATVAECDLWIVTMGNDTPQGLHEFRMELLELAQLGKPVVAALTPGLHENGLIDGHNIIYIDPSDARGSAARIVQLAAIPGALPTLGQNLREHVQQNFSLANTVDQLLRAPGLQRRNQKSV